MEFNFVVQNEHLRENDVELFFAEKQETIENFSFVPPGATLWDLLVLAGIFPSKGQARKDKKFQNGTIQEGWTEMIVGKKKTAIYILKPFLQSV